MLARAAEQLVARYGDHEFDAELRVARDQYCERRGRVFEDDEEWESFTRAFLEWYVVERPWRDSASSPARLAVDEASDEEEARALQALANSQRCLVAIESIGNKGIKVEDLVGGAMFFVSENRALVGMDVGDVLELRLFGFAEEVSLGRTFVFHPPGTLAAIRSLITGMREAGRSRADIIDHIAMLRSRSRSYRHVSPLRIYENDGLQEGVS